MRDVINVLKFAGGFSTAYPCIRIHFTIYLEAYLGRGGIFECISTYPLHNILRSLLGEGWYFLLRIRVSSLFRGAASKWQLLRIVLRAHMIKCLLPEIRSGRTGQYVGLGCAP